MKNHIKIITIVTSLLLFCGIAPLSAATDLSCSGGNALWMGSAVSVDSSLTVTHDAGNIDAALVSIGTGFESGNDTLAFSNQLGITGTWDGTTGVLTLSGTTTPANYQAALRSVTFNTTALPGTTRNIEFNLGKALTADPCNTGTDHFYEFISNKGISWPDAETAASNSTLFGLTGYLAVITCEEENDFIRSKLNGNGWIGASDEADEGVWRWVTGPSDYNGVQFWSGEAGGFAVGGNYSNWNSGEPNDDVNSGGEDYAHVLGNPFFGTNIGKWNDLNAPLEENYIPLGYLIEYGGMSGDPAVKITDTKVVQLTAPGTIIIEKQTDPAGATESFEFDTDYGANFTLTHGLTNNSGDLTPGTYSVNETNIPSGWSQTSATCDDGSDPGAIGLSAGETVTCTFTNTQEDCNGVPGGTATVDNCGVCVGGDTGLTACPNDCNGVPDGTATVDNCGVCVGGDTGLTACMPTVPAVMCVTSTPSFGSYSIGSVIDIFIRFNVSVWVKGTPLLALRTGAVPGTASYSSGSGTGLLTFSYAVTEGDNITDLDYWSEWALELNGGQIYGNEGIDADLVLPAPGGACSLGVTPDKPCSLTDTSLCVLADIYPVYRFYNPGLLKHFYTTDEYEKEHLKANAADVWRYEGIAYYAYLPLQYGGSSRLQKNTLLAVHRFYSEVLQVHLYTIDENEKEHLIAEAADVWRYESAAFYLPAVYLNGMLPVYRLYSDSLKEHLFTVDENEMNHLVETAGDIWRYEGIAYYAFP